VRIRIVVKIRPAKLKEIISPNPTVVIVMIVM